MIGLIIWPDGRNHYLFEFQLRQHQLKPYCEDSLDKFRVYLHQLLLLLECQAHLFDLFPRKNSIFPSLMQNNLEQV